MISSGMVGVVTVTYNSAKVIADFMASMLNQSYSNFVLYVVDNVSFDDTLELLKEYRDPRVRIIRSSTNLGIAEGNNVGIRAALNESCDYVLLINNDTVFGASLISNLVEGLKDYACDMVVPKILYFDQPDKVWAAGGVFSRLRGRPKHIGYGRRDDGRFDVARKVQFGPMCCMLITRSVFDRIGLIDPKYFVYFDDADFCLRAYRAGVVLYYLPTALLYHKVSSLIGHRSELALQFVTRNHVYYVLKHFKLLALFYYIPVCQAHVFVRCWCAKRKIRGFVLAEKAFCKAFSLFRAPIGTDAAIFQI